MSTLDELRAIKNMAYLRTIGNKPSVRQPERRLIRLQRLALVPVVIFTMAVTAPVVMAASACEAEDSSRARVGTSAFGCVWWGAFQGNGHGATVWNRPNG